MQIEVTERAIKDLSNLPEEVTETYISKKDAIEKNLELDAIPKDTNTFNEMPSAKKGSS